jgi:hypothetical protein
MPVLPIEDHLPGMGLIGGAGKIEDMVWIAGVFSHMISFGP